MVIEVEQEKYNVRFHADKKSETHLDGSTKVLTICEIYRLSEEPVRKDMVGKGIARQNRKDQHSKKAGRKIAFGLALKSMTTNKVLRRTFWDIYNEGKFSKSGAEALKRRG